MSDYIVVDPISANQVVVNVLSVGERGVPGPAADPALLNAAVSQASESADIAIGAASTSTTQAGIATTAALDAATERGLARAWAISPTPPDGPGTISAKTGAEIAESWAIDPLQPDGPDTMSAKTGAEIAALLAFALEDAVNSVSSLVYASRALAAVAIVPVPVRVIAYSANGLTVRLQRDATGTALTTADGAKWSPDGVPMFEHFGAVGDGVADDSAAIDLCVTHILAKQVAGMIGPRTYRMNTAVQKTVGRVSWALVGTPGLSKIYIPATNTTGGIIVRSTTRQCRGYFYGFEMVRGGLQGDAGGAGGTGFAFSQVEGGADQGQSLIAEKVFCTLEQVDASNKRFDVGLDFSGHFNPMLRDCTAFGPNKKAGFAELNYAEAVAAVGASVGLKLTGAYNPTLDTCLTAGWADAVLADVFEANATVAASNGTGGTRVTVSNGTAPFTTGSLIRGFGGAPVAYQSDMVVTRISETQFDVPVAFTSTFTGKFSLVQGPEAFTIRGGTYIHSLRGVNFKRLDREPTLWTTGAHFNNWQRNMKLDGVRFFDIKGNSFYNIDLANGYGSPFVDIELLNASNGSVDGNRFDFNGQSARKHVSVSSNGTFESGHRVRVEGNAFRSNAATAVEIGAGCLKCVVGPNTREGTYATYYSLQPDTLRIDQTASYSGTWTPDLMFNSLTAGITYAARSGSYRVDGGVFTATISMELTSKGLEVGFADITLPALPAEVGSYIVDNGFGQMPTASNMLALGPVTIAALTNTPPVARLRQVGATGTAALTDANFTNTSVFTLSMSFNLLIG